MKLREKHEAELRAAMVRAIGRHKNIRRAAKALGMPKSTLYDKARELGLKTDWSRR